MGDKEVYDRRQDVGQKMFVGILTAVLTTIFIGSLGLSIRAGEKNHALELRVVKLEVFVANQDRLNIKLDKILSRIEE